MVRRAILKGLAIPGYQVPFASRKMPSSYGWDTSGVQVVQVRTRKAREMRQYLDSLCLGFVESSQLR